MKGESVRHHPAKQLLAIIIITENGGGEVGESAPSSPPSCDTNTLSSVSSYYTRFIFVDILPRLLTEQSPNKPTTSFGQQRRHHRMLSGVSSPHSVSFRGPPDEEEQVEYVKQQKVSPSQSLLEGRSSSSRRRRDFMSGSKGGRRRIKVAPVISILCVFLLPHRTAHPLPLCCRNFPRFLRLRHRRRREIGRRVGVPPRDEANDEPGVKRR